MVKVPWIVNSSCIELRKSHDVKEWWRSTVAFTFSLFASWCFTFTFSSCTTSTCTCATSSSIWPSVSENHCSWTHWNSNLRPLGTIFRWSSQQLAPIFSQLIEAERRQSTMQFQQQMMFQQMSSQSQQTSQSEMNMIMMMMMMMLMLMLMRMMTQRPLTAPMDHVGHTENSKTVV